MGKRGNEVLVLPIFCYNGSNKGARGNINRGRDLPLIRKLGKEHDVESFDEQWRWCYIALEGATVTDKEKEKLNKIIDTEPNIAEAHRIYIQSLQSDDKDLQLHMLQELNAEWRYAGELATARRTGLKEGREEGLTQGRTQGLEEGKAEGKVEGRAEGMAEGMLEAKREDTKAMKTAGLDINLIIQCTGLSEKEVSAL